MLFREYVPSDINIFKDATSISLFIIFLVLFILGLYIIHSQVALVKKGEFEVIDWVRCAVYGFIFSMAIMIVMGMAFIFAVNTPDFWEQKAWESEPVTPPDISPLWLVAPLLICLGYISIYPLIDFLYIAISEETDEGLTPFHKFLGDHWINRSKSRSGKICMAIILYSFFIVPPILLERAGAPFIMVLVTWMLVYPMMILTFYGAKGYIAGLSNVYYHLPDRLYEVF